MYQWIRKSVFVLGLMLFLSGCNSDGTPAGKIVFESVRDGNSEVYVMESDGSNLVNLTNNAAYDGTPTWSPDGQRIAFTSERFGNPDIYLMNADGSDPTQLTDGGGFNVVPDWSPDGSKILFVSNRTYKLQLERGQLEIPGNSKLWTIDIEGGEPARLTSSLGLDIYGSWSPDGESVVFMSVRDENPEIYMLRPDKFEENLTNSPALDLNPDWSSDGTKIVFMSDRDGNMEIYIMDLEAEGTITNISNHPANDGDPAWSPDGTRIVFTSDRDGNIEIYIMDADGSNPQRLTDNLADDIHPQWQP